MSRSITWLHLSDIHFQQDDLKFERKKVMKGLLEQIKREREEGRKADFIFITGDLAAKGMKYNMTKNFLDKLLKETNVSKSHLFIVPGNHDVNLSLTEFRIIVPKDRRKANNRLTKNQLVGLLPRFDHYEKFYNSYFNNHSTFSKSEPYQCQDLTHNGIKIGIICLNTCFFYKAKNSQGNLWIGTEATEKAFKKIGQADLKFVLHHHPLSWLHEEEHLYLEELFSREQVISLYGHLHKPYVEFSSSPFGQFSKFCTGALHKTGASLQHALWGTVDIDQGYTRIKAIQHDSARPNFWKVYHFDKDTKKDECELPAPGACNFPKGRCKLSKIARSNLGKEIKKVKLSDAERLEFQGNKIESLNGELWRLDRLKYLRLSHNGLTKIDEGIGNLTRLKELDLRSNRLEELPNGIISLKEIEKLFLSTNSLGGTLPDIWTLPKLKILLLQWNKLKSLPSIKQSTNSSPLECLELHGNLMENLPQGINHLTGLKRLILSINNLKNISPEIGSLGNLKELFLNRNKINCLPPELGKLKELVTLEVSENDLTALPQEISRLKKLKTLEVKRNKLSALPPQISGLAKLKSLELSCNMISHFEPNFIFPVHLHRLFLDNNQLKKLPSSLIRLKQLRILCLMGNPINDFPSVLMELPQLKEIRLDKKQYKKWKIALDKLPNTKKKSLQIQVIG